MYLYQVFYLYVLYDKHRLLTRTAITCRAFNADGQCFLWG